MAKRTDRQVQDLARKIVAENPGGIRYSALIRGISGQFPEIPRKRIEWSVWNLDSLFPTEIAKPSRGLFTPITPLDQQAPVAEKADQAAGDGDRAKESDFYEPVADLLKNDLGEVVEAVELGGSGLRSKWATPDVVGTYKPLARHHIKFDIEIASAEVKIDTQPVVAFGQAVAYHLFSSKTYIAMPKTMTEEDKSRLESLCMLFGVGLVLFELNKDDPRFEIRMRAQRFAPDMFYVNEFAERLKIHDPDKFQKLFG